MADALPRLRSVVLDTTDARALAEFYRELPAAAPRLLHLRGPGAGRN
ncbi:MAG TPA: hypothetical protein VMU63_05660 [Acidimicrobiales bacterium]|nr:hypothetical protein [Acidimicrobiales bacterium]